MLKIPVIWRLLWYFYCNFFEIPEELAGQMYLNGVLWQVCYAGKLQGRKVSSLAGEYISSRNHKESLSSLPSAICNHIASLQKSENASFVADEITPKLA